MLKNIFSPNSNLSVVQHGGGRKRKRRRKKKEKRGKEKGQMTQKRTKTRPFYGNPLFYKKGRTGRGEEEGKKERGKNARKSQISCRLYRVC